MILPSITDHFGSTDDIAWYAGVYPLTICATQLAFGKFYALYPIKWVYIAAIVIFEIGSTLCAAAPTSAVLIVGRAVAGIGSAGIVGGSFTIIGFAVPLEKRPLFMGLLSGIFGLALIAGPPVGGAFSTYVSWRWCVSSKSQVCYTLLDDHLVLDQFTHRRNCYLGRHPVIQIAASSIATSRRTLGKDLGNRSTWLADLAWWCNLSVPCADLGRVQV